MTLESDIRQAENGGKVGWNEQKQLWFPHDSVEGGTKTIAYGHKCTADEQKQWTDTGITDTKADELFTTDLSTAKSAVTALLSSNHVSTALKDGAMAALTELAYNIGQTKLNGFHKMWTALAKTPPDYEEAAAQMKDSKWYKDVKATRGDRMIASMKD